MAKKVIKEDAKKTTKTSKKDVVVENNVIETGETLNDVETPITEEETVTEAVKEEVTPETEETVTETEEVKEETEEETPVEVKNNTEETPNQEDTSKQELEAMREGAFQDNEKKQVKKMRRDNNFTNYWNGVSDGWYN